VSEDTDCLTFGSPRLIKNFSKKESDMYEIVLSNVLKDLGLTMEQFIDVCILTGCDYTGKIEGIGPINSHKLILKYNNIEGVIDWIKGNEKYKICEGGFDYVNVRDLFKKPLCDLNVELEWKEIQSQKLYEFFCLKKDFNPKRIENAFKRILK
jgi:flap endonuclease-1